VDDRTPRDIVFGIIGYPAVLVAHDLQLFTVLAAQPQTLAEVCTALHIARRPAEAFLAICASLDLVQLHEGQYRLTPLAEDYFLPESPTYFGGYWDLMIANYSMYSFASLKQAILTDTPQAYSGGDVYRSHDEQADRARAFTRAMHSASMGAGLAWPDVIDLSRHQLLLDIGGGSGCHAIGAALRWPHLHAMVLKFAPVCEVAAEFIVHYGLQGRIRTHVGDMWQEPFPAADLHFYSGIYQNWPLEAEGRTLTRKNFESLTSGGRLIIHDMLYNDDKTGPFPAAAQSINMLLWIKGQQHSGQEFTAMLREAGFTDIEVTPTFGYWSIVTGRKP